jgi:hypothetical protein
MVRRAMRSRRRRGDDITGMVAKGPSPIRNVLRVGHVPTRGPFDDRRIAAASDPFPNAASDGVAACLDR